MNQERTRIIGEESAKFLDPSFAQLDLSAFPDLSHPAPEEFATEDRHGLNRVIVSGSNHLKALAENPDREALEQIARETGDAGLIERLQDERENPEAKAFMAAHPSYYRHDDNYDTIREYLEERGLAFNRQNLAAAYKVLSRTGKLQVDPDTPRPLTERDSRAIVLQAATGDVEGEPLVDTCNFVCPSKSQKCGSTPRAAKKLWTLSPRLNIGGYWKKRFFLLGPWSRQLLTNPRPTRIYSRVRRRAHTNSPTTRRSLECLPSCRERRLALDSVRPGTTSTRAGSATGSQ
jgi:hypothetical protein